MQASKKIIDFDNLSQMYSIIKEEYQEILCEDEFNDVFHDGNCIESVEYVWDSRYYLYTLKDGQRYKMFESQDDMFADYWWDTLTQMKMSAGNNTFVKDVVDKLLHSKCIDYDTLSYYAFANDYGAMIADYDGICIEIVGWNELEQSNQVIAWLGRVE